MRRTAALAAWAAAAVALPNSEFHRNAFRNQINQIKASNGTGGWCFAKECKKPDLQYERILHAQPGVQWMDDGGYCGSWSIQRSTMVKGAWISEAQVRNHTVPGGGHDEEILTTNIETALTNLKLKYSGFQYKTLPTPQADAYRKWIKQQIVAGNAVVWMIMQPGESYPVYPALPKTDYYGHIEPVVGVMSSRPLNDTNWYDDDYIVHYTDADHNPYYRTMASLPETAEKCAAREGNCHSDYVGYPAINNDYGFGWAIEGFADDRADALPVSLTVDQDEPEKTSVSLKATLTISGLTAGTKYTVYRWDSVQTAFDYNNAHSTHAFTATDSTESYVDSEGVLSKGITYYRCVVA